MFRTSRGVLALWFLLSLNLVDDLRAGILTVNSLGDPGVAADGLVTLREAIVAANADTVTDLGDVASGNDLINFTVTSGTIALTSRLPNITSSITIIGAPAMTLTIDGAGAGTQGIFFINVPGGNFNITFFNIVNGTMTAGNGGFGSIGPGGGGAAGMGGAMLISAGSVLCGSVTFINNRANGGNGGAGGTLIIIPGHPFADHGAAGGGGIGGNGGQAGLGPASGTPGGNGGPYGNTGGVGGTVGIGGFAGNGGDGGGGGGGGTGIATRAGVGGFGGGGGGAGVASGAQGPAGIGGFGGGGGGGSYDLSNPAIQGLGAAGGTFGGSGGGATGFPNPYFGGGGGGGGGLGGAVFIRAGSLSLSSCTFTGNRAVRGLAGTSPAVAPAATAGSGKGGAVFVNAGATLSATNVIFSANNADDALALATDNQHFYGPGAIDFYGASITKTLTSPSPVIAGNTHTFSITVTNTGTLPLTNVAVADPLVPACAQTIGVMAPAATQTYSCSGLAPLSSYTNVATVTATAGSGTVSVSDSESVTVIANPFTLSLTPPTQMVRTFDAPGFFVSLANSDLGVPITNVVITGPGSCFDPGPLTVPAGSSTVPFSCTTGPLLVDTNVTVSATGMFGSTAVSASQTVAVDVINPALSVSVAPPSQQILSGGIASFTITVTNTGDVALTGVTLDSNVPSCDSTIGALAVAASIDVLCSTAALVADLTNSVTASGIPPIGPAVTATASGTVTIVLPSISIAMTPPSQQIVAGTTAAFTITVTNTGNSALTGVTVTDANAPLCDRAIGILAVSGSNTYSCSSGALAADITNTATVTGTPPIGPDVTASASADVDVINPALTVTMAPPTRQILSGQSADFTITVTNSGDVELTAVTVTDALVPACDQVVGTLAIAASTSYTCTAASVVADFTNVALVSATAPAGPAVTGSASAVVDVVAPALLVTMLPPTQQIVTNGTATFNVSVQNSGDSMLTSVTVTSALVPACDTMIEAIAAGASSNYSCTATNVLADFTNTIQVVATPVVGPNLNAGASSVVDVIAPGVDIAMAPPLQQVQVGQAAAFTITVTNTSDVAITAVTVTDPLVSDCERVLGTLTAGQISTYVCTAPAVAADFTNVASVTGQPPVGAAVTDTANASVDAIAPSITITQAPPTQQVLSGMDATFTMTVTNTGDVALTSVVVSDALAPACGRTVGPLAVAATDTFTCTATSVSADFTNVAQVSANAPAGPPVTSSSSANVDVVSPALLVTMLPPTQQVLANGTATFNVSVQNSGDSMLTSITVTSALVPACNTVIEAITAGASSNYSCTATNVLTDFTNTIQVVATPVVGPSLNATASAVVDVIAPGVDIAMAPAVRQILAGQAAAFNITVTNTSDVTLTAVTVTDALVSDCARVVGALAPAQVSAYSCSAPAVGADFTNVAAVTGQPPAGPAVTDSATASVDVISPAISIAQTPPTQQVLSGLDATFTITVTNTGDVALTNVVVTDALAPACARTLGSLAVAGVNTFTCTATNVLGGFTNVANVSADSPVPPALSATSSAVVVVNDDQDGVAAAVENAGPNAGDANGDGIPDAIQSNVASFPNLLNATYESIEVPSPCGLRSVAAVGAASLPGVASQTFPFDAASFQITGCASAAVSIHYYSPPNLTGAFYMSNGPRPGIAAGWYPLASAITSATIAGNPVATVTFTLVDGQVGDNDLAVNGLIVTSGGVGIGAAIPALSVLALMMLALSLALVAAVVLRN